MSTDTTVPPLRQRMIEAMTARKLGPHSQRSHIQSCRRFAAFSKRSPDTATADDVRRFQLHLVDEAGLSICNRNRIMTGVKFLLRVTLRRHDFGAENYHPPEPGRLPLTISPNEAERLLAKTGSLRDHVMLSLGYGCGCSTGCPTARDFVPWRFSDASCRCPGLAVVIQASEKPSQILPSDRPGQN